MHTIYRVGYKKKCATFIFSINSLVTFRHCWIYEWTAEQVEIKLSPLKAVTKPDPSTQLIPRGL